MLSPCVMDILTKAFWSLLLVYVISKVVSFVKNRKEQNARLSNVAKKRAIIAQNMKALEDKLLVDGRLVTDSRQAILNLPVLDLIEALQKRRYTAVEVLHAYQAKALEVTKDINCVIEFIDEAEEWAKALDEADTIQGPLHGVPFSVKENAAIKGYDSSKGVAGYLFRPNKQDCVLVEAMKNLGAFPFCITNIPQTMQSYGCSNPVYGRTDNPVLKNRVPGGSSGGEAALIARGGSPFGIGTDIGGSLRAPAHFCGISTLKCTANRLSIKNFSGAITGIIGIASIPGFLCKDVKVLTLLHKLLLEDGYLATYDYTISPIPWREKKFNVGRKLRIGYFENDDIFPASPGVRRAVLEAKKALEAQGHVLVTAKVPCSVTKAMPAFLSIMHADECRQFLAILKNEKLDPLLVVTYHLFGLHRFWRPLIIFIVSLFSKVLSEYVKGMGGTRTRHSHQLWKALQEQTRVLEGFVSYYKELNLDLLMGPVFGSPAPLFTDIGQVFPAASYCALYNYISLPAGVVSVTHENDEDQKKLAEYPRNDVVLKTMAKTLQGAQGAPIGVQIIGLPFEEELVLAGMNALEDALQKPIR